MKYALDTNTVSYFVRGDGRVAERLMAHSPADICIPSVVQYELRYGAMRAALSSSRARALDDLLDSCACLSFGAEESVAAARLRTQLEKAGSPIGPYDTLIAATVLCAGATLVTRNTREFARVKGLKTVDWYA